MSVRMSILSLNGLSADSHATSSVDWADVSGYRQLSFGRNRGVFDVLALTQLQERSFLRIYRRIDDSTTVLVRSVRFRKLCKIDAVHQLHSVPGNCHPSRNVS